VRKLEADVRERGLALLVFGEWYNLESMTHMRFFDDNTRRWGAGPRRGARRAAAARGAGG
jgi:membrane-bound transcription factor site-1 protease